MNKHPKGNVVFVIFIKVFFFLIKYQKNIPIFFLSTFLSSFLFIMLNWLSLFLDNISKISIIKKLKIEKYNTQKY